MHEHAVIAINAAKHAKQWGFYAARQYVIKRGVPIWLFTLAYLLEWEQQHGM